MDDAALDRLQHQIAALSRAQLEALVAANVQTGIAIAPESLAPAPAPALTTQIGLFQWLDDDVMTKLVNEHLDAPTRLSFLTRVCKSMRSLGIPWTALGLVDGSRLRVKQTPDILWLAPGAIDHSADKLEGFVRAHSSTMTRLSLDLHESPKDSREIARIVGAAPNVTDLALSGNRMNAPAMKALARLPHLRKLKRFELGFKASKKMDAVKLLSSMTVLNGLHLNNGLTAEAFYTVCEVWRRARGGGALLLERLTIGRSICGNLRALIPALSVACPDLRELKFCVYFWELPATLVLPHGLRKLDASLCGFANSQKSEADSGTYEYRNADTEELVHRLLSAAPKLEECTIGWHNPNQSLDWNTKWDFGLGEALSAVPPTLRALTLCNMNVDGAPSLHGLPQPTALCTLTIDGCGVTDSMLDAMDRVGVLVV